MLYDKEMPTLRDKIIEKAEKDKKVEVKKDKEEKKYEKKKK